MKPSTPRRFYLITYPRTGSNLLVRMLGLDNQPHMRGGNDRGGYVFLPVVKLVTELGLRKKEVEDWTEEEIMQVRRSYQECFAEFQEYLDQASADECSVFIKEHVHFLIDPTTLSKFTFRGTPKPSWMVQHLPESCEEKAARFLRNQTILPDEFLRSWLPTFLIRHPALAFPSLYRALLELEGTGNPCEDEQLGEHCMTMHWTRNLYDWYVWQGNRAGWPIVLDADDIMTDPGLVSEYCQLLGMDPSLLNSSWTPVSKQQLSHMDTFTKRYLSTLLASGGIVADKIAGHIDIELEAKKWCSEFGERAGKRLERLVREAMPDYEFLKARRFTAKRHFQKNAHGVLCRDGSEMP
ncbi:hypothetical protein ANOM_011376 [Aspergillus nomiae NRRL 13137]|uniref:Sulfotransferase family protein n=1 Tax=Aspergillus nomiae NRRL (strain ATCC 15546 / NRRL 13137 / CBS 260.88 / M93) TaxID=1509407 RepID=A0A0L1ILT5_ASPN3|nr:uncharacterized protein ANOM_011376 [Aspergillus nomiae NRRL 13137]KNG80235.1 hypothetical protein ANOM_011376 [Aspergillus nomiae NRRL 13137]